MNDIAVLIPTFGRIDRWERLVENIRTTAYSDSGVSIYFVVENYEFKNEMEEIARRLNVGIIINDGDSYVSAINKGYHETKEPFIFCGSDDIVFARGWDQEMVMEFRNPAIGFVGAKDEWTISKTGKHASHFMVRRKYIEEASGVEDEKNVIYSSEYQHIMCDIESEQTAMKRGAFIIANTVITHNHWFVGTAEKDATYERAISVQKVDELMYNSRRKNFEQYLFEELFQGNIVPVNQKKLSIVVASYNQTKYLKETLESLEKNTYHPYELIIVDDVSGEETREFLKEYGKKHVGVSIIYLDKHHYTNEVWNIGLRTATGDCVAVLNNDITLSKYWDVYLMNDLDDPRVWLANPYQTDEGFRVNNDPDQPMVSYGKHDRAGGIDIRGSCWMIKRQAIERIGDIPSDLVMWFGDWWLAIQVTDIHKRRSVFNPKSVIHHYGSKSSMELEKSHGVFNWIIRGDAYAFKEMTGISVDHWLRIVYEGVGRRTKYEHC